MPIHKVVFWTAFFFVVALLVASLVSCADLPNRYPQGNEAQWRAPNLEQRLSDAVEEAERDRENR